MNEWQQITNLKHLTLILFLLISSFVNSQTYSATGAAIPDDGSITDYPITVSGLSPSTIDTTLFGLESVCLNLTHTWDADLDIRLVAPDGTEVILSSGNGYDGDNYTNTCFRSDAANSIISGGAPFTGTFKPQTSLGKVNNGQNGNGTWNLRIHDLYPGADTGELLDFSLFFGNNPASIFKFKSSNLPILVINTSGQSIPDEPKITAQMGIIDNGYGNRNYSTDAFNGYDGTIGIEMRGSSSQMFPKKPYGFETRDNSGNNLDVSLLGMPPESDWSLIPNYSDKTLMHNSMSYDLSQLMGHWASRNRYCEVVLNGEYQGVYALMEKIKRDSNRVSISKLDPNEITGDDLTGGYVVKIDKWTGSNNDGWESNYLPAQSGSGQKIVFLYDYPKADKIVPQQKYYIQQFIDTVETVLYSPGFDDPVNGYNKYIKTSTFIDYFILNELSKNVDGYRLSTFLHKDKNSKGGKLKIGPVWDYDLAWRNANYCGGDDYTGWAYKFGDICSGDGWQIPFWWDRLMEDTLFKNALKCRWENLRQSIIDTTFLYQYIDSVTTYLNEAQTRNFKYWPILGTYVWPNPNPIPSTYEGEIINLKNWINNRIAWLDDNMPGRCDHASIDEFSFNFDFSLYPNPASNYVTIELNSITKIIGYQIYDCYGNLVKESFNHAGFQKNIDIPLNYNAGVYFITLFTKNSSLTKKLVIF